MRGVSPVFVAYADMFALLASLFLVMIQEKKPPHAGIEQNAEYIATVTWDVETYDADLDLWLVTPPNSAPVFFGNRQSGCVALDQDNRGWVDSQVTNADGSTAKFKMAKETISLRCRQTGHYDLGVNFYGYSAHPPQTPPASGHLGIKAHVEVIKLNPIVKTVFEKDVVMDRETQTTNVVSFDLLPNGDLQFTDVPLAPVTLTRGNK